MSYWLQSFQYEFRCKLLEYHQGIWQRAVPDIRGCHYLINPVDTTMMLVQLNLSINSRWKYVLCVRSMRMEQFATTGMGTGSLLTADMSAGDSLTFSISQIEIWHSPHLLFVC